MFKVGDKVEVCERYGFRSQCSDDPVRWQGTIVRETKTRWVVLGSLAVDVTPFRKRDREQIGLFGLYRYIRAATPAPTAAGGE